MTPCTVEWTYAEPQPETPTTGSLLIDKEVEGSDAAASSFQFEVTKGDFSTTADGDELLTGLEPGDYMVSETNSDGYTVDYSGDCSEDGNGYVTIAAGEQATCTVTNTIIKEDDQPSQTTGSVTLIKQLVEGKEGPLAPEDFELRIRDMGDEQSEPQTIVTGTAASMDTGTYYVSESEEDNYVMTDFACTGAEIIGTQTFELTPDANVTCTFTNEYDAPPALLTVHKNVENDEQGNDEGEEDLSPSDFQMYLNGEPVDQKETREYEAGSYILSEGPSGDFEGDEFDIYGYTQSDVSCDVIDQQQESRTPITVDADGRFDMEPGKEYECTVTNNEDAGGWLNVILKFRDRHGNLLEEQPREVEVRMECEDSTPAEGNDICDEPRVEDEPPHENVLTYALSRLWSAMVPTAHAAGPVTVPLTVGVPTYLGAGAFSVSHSSVSGYNVTFSGNCSAFGIVNIVPGDDQTCVITFTQKSGGGGSLPSNGTLNVITTIINDNGGSLSAPGVTMSVTTGGPLATFPGASTPGISLVIPVGAYTVSSPAMPGYDRTDSGCIGSMPAGSTITCTVTYDDQDPNAQQPLPNVPPPVVPPPTVPPSGPAPTSPTPTVLGDTDTDSDPAAGVTALPRTGGSALPLIVSALCAAYVAVSRKKR